MTKVTHGLGWHRDLPDIRDYSLKSKEVSSMFKKSALMKATKAAAPNSKDLSSWCSSIEDQGSIGSCTAQAGVGLLEYYENRAFGRFLDASRLFLYKVTRNYLQLTGDTGAYLRSATSPSLRP